MMMGFGFLSMLFVIALPIVGIIALIVWFNKINQQGNPFSTNPPSEKREQIKDMGTKRFCSHCGAGLQDTWSHCPQCGAPVGS